MAEEFVVAEAPADTTATGQDAIAVSRPASGVRRSRQQEGYSPRVALGLYIRNYRTAAAMSRATLAQKIDRSTVWVQRIELATAANPSTETLQRIGDALNIPPDDLNAYIGKLKQDRSMLIKAYVPNRMGILNKLSAIVAQEHLNIREMTTSGEAIGVIQFRIDYPSSKAWERICHSLDALQATGDVHRWERETAEQAKGSRRDGTQALGFLTTEMDHGGDALGLHRLLPSPSEIAMVIEAENRTGLVFELTRITRRANVDIKALTTSTRVRNAGSRGSSQVEEAGIWLLMNDPGRLLLRRMKERIGRIRGVSRVFYLEAWPTAAGSEPADWPRIK